jgi:hypothetical protein
VSRPVERQAQILLLLVPRRLAGVAAAAEQFWMVLCLLTVQRSVGVAPALMHLPLLASLVMAVLLKRPCYLLHRWLVQMAALLMVAILMLLHCGPLQTA